MAGFQPFKPKVKIKDGATCAFDETNAIITQPDHFDILTYTLAAGSENSANRSHDRSADAKPRETLFPEICRPPSI